MISVYKGGFVYSHVSILLHLWVLKAAKYEKRKNSNYTSNTSLLQVSHSIQRVSKILLNNLVQWDAV